MSLFALILAALGGSAALAGFGGFLGTSFGGQSRTSRGVPPVEEEPPAVDPPVEEEPVGEEPPVVDPPVLEPPVVEEPHDHPITPPPTNGMTPEEITAWVVDVLNSDEMHIHSSDSPKIGDHMAVLDLVNRAETTHVAITDGSWFDPATWYNGDIPGDNAKVLIPEGVSVDYGEISEARLFTVRVDGTLDFATDTDSQMIFDTMVVSPSGHLIIGTVDDPVRPDVDVDLIVANNGPIDTDWDPLLLSRGLISHGETTIHGDVKDSHDKVDENPMEGDTSVSFAEVPEGWQVGDKIVIAGTHYDGYKWSNDAGGTVLHPHEDEERVITSIDDDGTVHFKDPLVFDHDTPRDDLKTSVANYTRNVSIETENPEDAEVYERGHLMFMHSDEVDVRYLEVYELGRTDKSVESFDVSDFETTEYDSNVQGRYSLHLHSTGVDDIDDPAIVIGTSVWGSPGWGYVHHDSNAILENNASYDTFGAGYVAETGNETGTWSDNIAIYAEGINWGIPKTTSELDGNFDTGRGGDGFWFQGRMIASSDNIAVSVNTGFVYFHRNGDDRMIASDTENTEYPDIYFGKDTVWPDDVAIQLFDGNETFAAKEGLHIVKANPNQGHDVWSTLSDFTAWNVISGAHLEYTSHYILDGFDVIGKEATTFSTADDGISLGKNTSDIVIIDPQIEGFENGIDLLKKFVNETLDPELHDFIVIDPIITNVTKEFLNYDPSLDRILTRDDLGNHDPDLELNISMMTGGDLSISGTKTDALGTTDFPGGTDTIKISQRNLPNFLEKTGYWTTSDGQSYTLVDIYFTDRLTGDIYHETHPVYMSDEFANKMGEPWWDYNDVPDNGIQNLTEVNGDLWAGDRILDTATLAIPGSANAITAMPAEVNYDEAMMVESGLNTPTDAALTGVRFTAALSR